MAQQVVAAALTDNFRCGVSAQLFCRTVPVHDAAVRIDKIDRVIQFIQKQFVEIGVVRQELFHLGGLHGPGDDLACVLRWLSLYHLDGMSAELTVTIGALGGVEGYESTHLMAPISSIRGRCGTGRG